MATGRPLAVVTGASAGIGEACARHLSRAGFDLLLGARREERLQPLAAELGARYRVLDVTDPVSVSEFCQGVEELAVLVNNAGGARGLEPIEQTVPENWSWMWEVNVMGLVRMTKALIPALERSGRGLILNLSSIAAMEVYEGGAGYTAVKHAVRAISRTLRLELVGRPIRITELCPGLVRTDFSINRFQGDAERAERVYAGVDALTADDVAEVVVFAATRPPNVDLDEIVIRPVQQATSYKVARR